MLRALPCAGCPAPVGEGLEAPVSFVDDPVPARSRPWVDTEDLHGQRVRRASDGYRQRVELVDLTAIAGRGPAWGMESEDLNATLLVWREGEGQPAHVNAERDVAIVALAGSGTLVVDGAEHALRPGMLAVVPRGARRSVVAGRDGLRCVTVSPAPRRAPDRTTHGAWLKPTVSDFSRTPLPYTDARANARVSDCKSDTGAQAHDATASSTASGMSKFA